jgi:hypothetical protein
MNKYLATEVQVGKIDLNLYEKFPYLSLKFENVIIKEPASFGSGQLASAGEIFLTFNPVNLIQEKYYIENIYIEKSEINLALNKKGESNYNIFKEDTASDKRSKEAADFHLKKISLENVTVNYLNEVSRQFYSVLHRKAIARLESVNEEYMIDLDGDIHVNDISIAGKSYFKNKDLIIDNALKYSVPQQYLEILPSSLQVEKSAFHVEGKYEFKDVSFIDMKIEGEKGKVQTLLSILPSEIYEKLSAYENSGNVYFSGQIKGEVSEKHNPEIKVDFGFEDANFMHPTTRGKIEKADLKGYFTNGSLRKPETSVLKISKFRGEFQQHIFTGSFLLQNFSHPYIEMNCAGIIELGPLFQFYPVPEIINPSGTVKADFSFAGKLADVQHNPEKIKASGEIILSNTSFSLKDFPHSFSNLGGNFLFNKNDVAVGDFTGRIANSDFTFNGYFRNLIGKILFAEEKMIIDANFSSDLLDLNTLLSFPGEKEAIAREVKEERSTHQLENYLIKLDCNIGLFRYNKMKIRNLRGTFDMVHPYYNLKNMHAELCGGTVNFNSKIIYTNTREIRTDAEVSDILIDSLFSSFNNFDQDFITSKQIRGSLSGRMTEFYTPLNENNELLYDNLEGKVNISIKNGQLLNFEPMQKLSRFVEEKELANIRFKEIQNEFFIKDNKIYIPRMQINSNISEITIAGEHTFDNFMDYRMVVPLKNYSKKDKDEVYGAVETDNRGAAKLHLLVKGPADSFKISYDKKATSQKVVSTVKSQKDDLKKIFRGDTRKEQKEKEKKKNQPTLTNDYIDVD